MAPTPTIAPGFDEIAARALRVIEKSGGGALCVYLGGRPVVDLWAGQRDPATGAPWEHDTMGMAWSTTKGVASTAVHLLADRGQVDLDAPVATYWPAFAANGKASITVTQLMAMEAGLYDIRHLIDDPWQMLDHQAMAEALAAARPAHPPGTANGYHALTYGWLTGELVRSITGASLGTFVRNEIAEPLDLDGFHVGTPAEELGRVAALPRLVPESAAVRAIAKAVDPVTRLLGFSPARFAAAFLPRRGHEVIASPEFLLAEVPGANGVFTARSLARFYAALGADEGLDGVRLWRPETRARATRTQNQRRDLVVPVRMGWQTGYHPTFPRRRASPSAFGFWGAYGSGAFADPSRDLAVGLVVREARGLPLTGLTKAIAAAVDRR